MKEIVSPIIASNKNVVTTFVTTFAAAAIALPIAFAVMPDAPKTSLAGAAGQETAAVSAADPGLGSCTTALDATPSTSALSVAPADTQRRVVVETVNYSSNNSGPTAQVGRDGVATAIQTTVGDVLSNNDIDILSGNTVDLSTVTNVTGDLTGTVTGTVLDALPVLPLTTLPL